MSKAYDTVDRNRLLTMLGDEIQDEITLNLVKLLFTETTLAVKIGKEIGVIFSTNIGVPQGDSISLLSRQSAKRSRRK